VQNLCGEPPTNRIGIAKILIDSYMAIELPLGLSDPVRVCIEHEFFSLAVTVIVRSASMILTESPIAISVFVPSGTCLTLEQQMSAKHKLVARTPLAFTPIYGIVSTMWVQ